MQWDQYGLPSLTSTKTCAPNFLHVSLLSDHERMGHYERDPSQPSTTLFTTMHLGVVCRSTGPLKTRTKFKMT